MVVVGITTRDHGFHHLLFLIDSRNVVQVFKKEKVNKLANLNSLKFQGLNCNVFCVPPLVVNSIRYIAKKATVMLVNTTWFNPAFCN